jgi:hypothetical protein
MTHSYKEIPGIFTGSYQKIPDVSGGGSFIEKRERCRE